MWCRPTASSPTSASGSRRRRATCGARPTRPATSPRRLFDLGAATARILADSPYRVALIASSGWSHAFLTPKNNYLWPDTPADRRMYEALRGCDWEAWRTLSAAAVEDSGQQEI